MRNTTTNSSLSWIALVFSIIAVIFAWIAFNRSGQNVLPALEEESRQAIETVRVRTALLEARLELLALRARIEAGESLDKVAEDINSIQNRLQAETAELSQEARQELQEVNQEFDQLEQSARNNSADAIGRLNNLLERLKIDIRTDEQ